MADQQAQPGTQSQPQQSYNGDEGQMNRHATAMQRYVEQHAKVTTLLFDVGMRRHSNPATTNATTNTNNNNDSNQENNNPISAVATQLASHFPVASYNANLLVNHVTSSAFSRSLSNPNGVPSPTPPSPFQLPPNHHQIHHPRLFQHAPPHAQAMNVMAAHQRAHHHHHHHHSQQQQHQRPTMMYVDNNNNNNVGAAGGNGNRTLYLRRLNPFSLGRFFGLSATFLSFFRLSLVLSLSLSHTVSKLLSPVIFPTDTSQMISNIAQYILTRMVDEHFYHWLNDLLTADDPQIFLLRQVNFMNIFVPSTIYLSAILSMPMIEGFLFYILGFTLAIMINIALSFSNGIRFEFN